MQVPSNMFLNKIGKPSKYLTLCMAIWVRVWVNLRRQDLQTNELIHVMKKGVLCACSGAAQNFGGLLATRFFLGFVEAAFYPGMWAYHGYPS